MGQHNPNLGLTKELESLEVFSKHLSQLEVNIQTLFNNINNTFNQPYTNENTQEKVVDLVKQVEVIEELINSNGVGSLKLEEASVDIKDIKTQSQLAQKRTQTIIGTHKKLLDASHSIIGNLDKINLEAGSEENNNNGGATSVNTPI